MWLALWSVKYCCSLFLHCLILLLVIFLNIVTSYDQWEASESNAFQNTNKIERVKEGDDAILSCRVKPDILGSYKVMWTHNTKTLTLSSSILTSNSRISLNRGHSQHTWDLKIKEVVPYDEGDYFCIINTQPPQQRIVTLSVRAPPKIIGKSTALVETITEGQSLRVNCNATGKPRPKMTWTRQDSKRKVEIGDDSSRDIYAIGGTLIIASAKRWMEGGYTCTAQNGVYPMAYKKLTLTVHFKPRVSFVNGRIGQHVGGTTMLQCRVESNPPANVHFEFNGKRLQPGRICDNIASLGGEHICMDIYNSNSGPLKKQVDLTIHNVTLGDYGQYACVASSDIGEARAFANLYKTFQLGLESRHRRLYQNDATKGYRTPAPMTNRRDRVETLVQQNTVKPHITAGRNNEGMACSVSLIVISFSLVAVLFHQLPCCSRI